MSLRDELQAIYEQHGKLTPKLVLDEASDPNHPLHDRFTWDDTEAAEKWRVHEAHELITRVKIVYRRSDGKQRDTRAFHAVNAGEGFEYRPAEEIVQDEVLTRILLNDMAHDWKALKARYGHFAEFAQLVRADVEQQQAS